jgi:hypothetical protein
VKPFGAVAGGAEWSSSIRACVILGV